MKDSLRYSCPRPADEQDPEETGGTDFGSRQCAQGLILLGSRASTSTPGRREHYENEEIKAMIGQIDGYKTRVREIEAEIEAIKIQENSRGRQARKKHPGQPEEVKGWPPASPREVPAVGRVPLDLLQSVLQRPAGLPLNSPARPGLPGS